MWYICRMKYYSAIKRNKIGSFVEMWMDLDSVIQSEVSQKEKNKFRILMHICESRKMVQMTGLQGRNRDTDVENKRMDTKGGNRGRGWWWWDELGDWD